MYRQWRCKSSLPTNIVHCVNERQIVLKDEYRDDLASRIYHQIVLQPSFTFKRKWTKLSKQSVCIGLDRRIYFNNHRDCYFNDGPNGNPCHLYHLPDDSSKIWAVILYHCQIREKSPTQEEQEVCLVILTSDGYLKVLNADTGEILRSVYLSTDIVFRYLSWADYLQTIQVKSVQAARQNPPRQAIGGSGGNIDRGRVLSLLVFKIHPLRFVAYLHIEKQIFGDDVRDASIFEDLLMVMTHSNKCCYYDFHWILNNCTNVDVSLDESLQLDSTSRFHPGVYPNSIPVSINITAIPPLLFVTKCIPEVGVSFGGSPLVYLHNARPPNINEFQIRELRTGKLVETLSTDIAAFHQDVAEFHFDDYRRIIHISGCTVSCYQLFESPNKSGLSLQLLYHIDFKQIFQEDVEVPLVSRRGRVIKRKKSAPSAFDDFVSAVQDLDYENELELLYAVVTLPEGEGTKALLCFLHDQKGIINKIVPLPTWDPSAGNSVYYELDCIIHLVQNGGQTTCHFYRLERNS